MKWWDPYETYNPNYSEMDHQAFISDQRTRVLSESISNVISSGNVAVVDSSILRELTFDVRARMGCYSAVQLQSSWDSHWSSLAICCLIRARFQYDRYEENGKVRFDKTPRTNEPYLLKNVTFIEDQFGRMLPTLRTEQRKIEEKQYELFEF